MDGSSAKRHAGKCAALVRACPDQVVEVDFELGRTGVADDMMFAQPFHAESSTLTSHANHIREQLVADRERDAPPAAVMFAGMADGEER